MSIDKPTGPWRRDRFLLLMACLAAVLCLPTVGCRTVEEGPSEQPEMDVPPEAEAEEAPAAEPEVAAEPEPPPRPRWTDDPYTEFPDCRGERTFAVGSGRSVFGGNASFRKALKDARRKLADAVVPYFSDPSAAADAAQMHAMHKTEDGTVYVLIGIPDQSAGDTPEPTLAAAPEAPPEEKPKPDLASGRSDDTKPVTTSPPEPDRPAATPQAAKPSAQGAAVDQRFITMPDKPEPAPPAPVAEPEPVAVAEEAQPSAASTYFSDRGYDFLDMLGIRIGGGSTVYLRARPTKLAMLGAGFFNGKWSGLHGRAAGHWREKRHEGGALVLYEVQYERTEPCGNAFMSDETFLPTSSARPRRNNRLSIEKSTWELADDDYHWADLGLGLGLLAVAADAHISPFQMADFLLGILGIDIADDDARNRAPGAQSEAADPEAMANR